MINSIGYLQFINEYNFAQCKRMVHLLVFA